MLLKEISDITVIAGENAISIDQLPPIWQEIESGKASVGIPDPHSYVQMAQLFQYKLEQGDIDLFHERRELAPFKSTFSQLFEQLAWETLEFYGHDFQIQNYPKFETILHELDSRVNGYADAVKVIRIGIDLFQEFGYEFPASFYHIHLSPIYRDHIFEERALRFDPREQDRKRAWDAVLHAQKVFAIQMKVQSIASKYGFTYHHGCGCESHLSSIDQSRGAFAYELCPEKRSRWIRSFIWTAWYEYAFFSLIPNTRYLV
jgi:hypothetical protein